MSKVAVVYWSSTGNTEAMANAVVDGAKEKGADVTLYECSDFRPEQDEFEPMFDGCKAELKDKKIALFGSYGWGDGEWMRNWEESCKEAGAVLATESVICNDMPDDDGVENCKALGAALA